MHKQFKQVLAIVLSMFKMNKFPVNKEGKSFLTDDMKAKLKEEYGDKFVAKFEAELAEAEKDGPIDIDSDEMIAIKTRLDKLKTNQRLY